MTGSTNRWRVTILAAFTVAAIAVLPRAGLADEAMAAKVEALVPALEAYVDKGMKDFDDPGLAIGIVTGDRLVYAKGFGTRSKGGAPVGTGTVFQIGSTTKAFLATTMAIGVDRKAFAWSDRIVDLYPDFQLKDGWITQEFRLYDIIAQRSGLPTYVNDAYGMMGASNADKIRSLRFVEPTFAFRADFTYTNITHLVAGDIVAKGLGAAGWPKVLETEIFVPLGMTSSSDTAEAMTASPDHAIGHLWYPNGTVEAPLTPYMPYLYEGAGAINSTVDDMARWLRLQLADGTFEGNRIVSAENLAVTRVPRVGISQNTAYAMGWVIQATPNGTITWHNGGTPAFGAYVGMARDHDVGVVVLTNEANMGLPDAIGEWALDRLMGNPEVDHVAARLAAAKAAAAAVATIFDKPADAQPPIPVAPLAGAYANPIFGETGLAEDGDGLVATLATGAKLRLAPWSGSTFTVTLVPEGEMAAVAANLGSGPFGFANFETDSSGKVSRFRASFGPGTQEYLFTRE